MIVSPDVGGVVRARGAGRAPRRADLAIVDKRRERAGESEVMNIIGDVTDRRCILFDDIVDSGRHAVQRRRGADATGGAVGVSAYVTHGVLSGSGGAAHSEIQIAGVGRHGHDPGDPRSPPCTI